MSLAVHIFCQIAILLVSKMVPFRFHFPISRGESLPFGSAGSQQHRSFVVTEVQRRAEAILPLAELKGLSYPGLSIHFLITALLMLSRSNCKSKALFHPSNFKTLSWRKQCSCVPLTTTEVPTQRILSVIKGTYLNLKLLF